MSTKRKALLSSVKDVKASLWRTRFTIAGRPVHPSDVYRLKGAYLLYYGCIIDCLSDTGMPDFDPVRYVLTLANADQSDVLSFLKSADLWLIDSISHPQSGWRSFKHFIRKRGTVCEELYLPYTRIVQAWQHGRAASDFRKMHTMFRFFSHLSLETQREMLEGEAWASYLANEDRLSRLTPTTSWEMANTIAREWFPKSDESRLMWELPCKHGNGAVAQGKLTIAQKYSPNVFVEDARLRYLRVRFPVPVPIQMGLVPSSEVPSRVVFVPKTWDKLRTICAEPATMQWWEQGISFNLRQYISDYLDKRYSEGLSTGEKRWSAQHKRKHPLSRRIDLTNQVKNCDAAWEGSIDGHLATIDLSAASDSVSWSLVKSIFRDTCLSMPLTCTRMRFYTYSDTGKDPSNVLASHKYAAMGSSLTFPIECIVFCLACEVAIRMAGGCPGSSEYRTYGDDIIIETKYVESLRQVLGEWGFIFNEDKSFYNDVPPFFRESCGAEWLDGEDVSAFRLSRKFRGMVTGRPSNDARLLSGLFEMSSDLVHYPTMRTILVNDTLHKYSDIGFSQDGCHGFYSPCATNFHLNKIWCEDWFTDVASVTDIVTVAGSKHRKSAAIRYFEWLRLSEHRTRLVYPEDRIDVRVDSTLPPRLSKRLVVE